MPNEDNEPLHTGGSSRPIPDPTVMTTEQINRLEATLRNLIAIEIKHVTELFDQKLAGVNERFDDLAERTLEQKQDTKSALDAALAAQKEAVASQTQSSDKSILKSETATVERIKSVETLLATSSKATDDKISDIKERVVAIEAIKLGATEAGATARSVVGDARASRDGIIAIIGVVILFLAPILAFAGAHIK